MSWKNELIKMVRGHVREDEPLAKHTTFRIGGPCTLFMDPADKDDLSVALGYLRKAHVPHIIIGQGSNLLFSDSGFRGCVLRIGTGLRKTTIEEGVAVAEAGVLLHHFIVELAVNGLSGMEGMAGIPGTMGGAVYMNAGAFGQVISDTLKSVEIIDETGSTRRLDKKNLLFRYRWSIFQNIPDWVIVSSKFELRDTPEEEMQERLVEFSKKRKKTQPWKYPSAGSFFKNPNGHSAGALIEHAGLKGHKVGGAMVSKKHANFIVNLGGATCDDILRLMKEVQRKVSKEMGVTLEPEVRIVPESKSRLNI